MNKEIKIGSVIAYINIFLNMIVNVFLTPFLISSLGNSEYGVYKVIQSFSAQLAIMSFGVSTIVIRNIVYYTTQNKNKEKENFIFMANIISIILALLVVAVGAILYQSIDIMYGNTFTVEELILSKKLFVLLVLNVGLSIITDNFTGLIRAHEKFIIFNGITTARIGIRILSIVLLISIGVKSIGIVLTDLFITLLVLLSSVIYSKFCLHEKGKFHYFDKKMFKESMTLSVAIFLQAIVNQVNQNVDNIILGALVGTKLVTIYSIGLSLYVSFNSLVTVFAGMYAPQAVKLVALGASGEELTDFAIKPARIQAIFAGLGIVGFVLLGKDFVKLWLGNGYDDVYKITLILIIPVVIPLVESITNNILDAKLKRMARSIILVGMCIFNTIVSIILIKTIGYIGAAYGTALSLILGHGILMNIYLQKKIGINVLRMFRSVFTGIFKAVILSLLLCTPFTLISGGWFIFILKALCIVGIYFFVMYFKGMNDDERNMCLKH